jgi:acyl-CoA synthetase (AMP-forming)/AMP-acid ligase II
MSLRRAIENATTSADRWVWSVGHSLHLTRFLGQSCLNGHREELAGKSVLIRTADQLTTAAALIELDGIALRVLICPPDIKDTHVPIIAAQAEIDAVVTTGDQPSVTALGVSRIIICQHLPSPAASRPTAELATEWLLLTSGTTGAPKIVRHSFQSLTGVIKPKDPVEALPIWSTFYDFRRYGGLQIFLRAVVGGGSLVLSDANEPVSDFLDRLAGRGVTHMSGTPSHWRRALMNPNVGAFNPSYVRMSGEIADQKIIDSLREAYPKAAVAHAYASTEAGVVFAVNDELEGFPASMVGKSDQDIEVKIVDETLRIRSPLTATNYVGPTAPSLRDEDGFVDTGDIVERRGDRYYFVGRRGGIINVGGLKVHPEEVESVINRHRAVHMSLVKSRKNPITGSIIVADVVLTVHDANGDQARLRSEILMECREVLPSYKVPALVRFVPKLDLADSGKLIRPNA